MYEKHKKNVLWPKMGHQIRSIHLAVFAGLLTMLASGINLRNGIRATTDGWAYWEGSVSVLSGQGYVYFGGQPITKFQPAFSIYWVGIQKILGISGWSLMLGMVSLACLTSFAWSYLVGSLSDRDTTPWYINLIFPIYVSMFISYHYFFFYSETLYLFLVALLLISVSQMYLQRRESKLIFHRVLLLNIILILLLCTRNAAIMFLPGVMLILLFAFDNLSVIKRMALSAFVGLSSLLGWTILRWLLGQSNSHPFRLGGRYTPRQYFGQISNSLADLFGPQTFDIGWLVLLLIGLAMFYIFYIMLWEKGKKAIDQQSAIAHMTAIILSSNVILYGLFNVTWIHDRLAGRFLWFLALATITILAAYITWLPRNKKYMCVVSVLLVVTLLQTQRTARFILGSLNRNSPRPYIGLNYTIRADYIMGEPVREGGIIVVAPPTYKWIDRHYAE